MPMLLFRSLVQLNQAVNRSANRMGRFNTIECLHAVLGFGLGIAALFVVGHGPEAIILGLTLAAVVCSALDVKLLVSPLRRDAGPLEIAPTIVDGGADYVLALKETWPAPLFRGSNPPPELELYESIDSDPGPIETHRHTICHSVEWLCSDRRYPGEFKFPGLAAVGIIESETERGGAIEKKTDAITFA